MSRDVETRDLTRAGVRLFIALLALSAMLLTTACVTPFHNASIEAQAQEALDEAGLDATARLHNDSLPFVDRHDLIVCVVVNRSIRDDDLAKAKIIVATLNAVRDVTLEHTEDTPMVQIWAYSEVPDREDPDDRCRNMLLAAWASETADLVSVTHSFNSSDAITYEVPYGNVEVKAQPEG